MYTISHVDPVTGKDATDVLHKIMMQAAVNMSGINVGMIGANYDTVYDAYYAASDMYGNAISALWDNPRAYGSYKRAARIRSNKFAKLVNQDADYIWQLIGLDY